MSADAPRGPPNAATSGKTAKPAGSGDHHFTNFRVARKNQIGRYHKPVQKFVEGLTDEQVATFKEEFTMYDTDQDGFITKDELGTVLRSLGEDPSEMELSKMVAEVDVNNNDKIEFEEFLTMMAVKMYAECDEHSLIEAFKVFDVDMSGEITAERFKEVFAVFQSDKGLSPDEVDEMVRVADTDGNGTINYKEFTDFILKSAGMGLGILNQLNENGEINDAHTVDDEIQEIEAIK